MEQGPLPACSYCLVFVSVNILLRQNGQIQDHILRARLRPKAGQSPGSLLAAYDRGTNSTRGKYPPLLPERWRIDKTNQTHELLETYSGIPRGEHDDHVHRTRDRLWEIRQYPCTGGGGWLKRQICLSTVYPEILARVKAGETAVDIGTFIGHDLRRLVVDGARFDRLWGIDIVNHFDVGFDFFKDRERWTGTSIEADFLTVETNPALKPLRSNTDIIFIASVLHQWDWTGQLRGATALTHFTKPGSLIAGLQMGKPVAGDVVMQGLKVPLYIHTPESFAKLWEEVGASTGTHWETHGWPRS